MWTCSITEPRLLIFISLVIAVGNMACGSREGYASRGMADEIARGGGSILSSFSLRVKEHRCSCGKETQRVCVLEFGGCWSAGTSERLVSNEKGAGWHTNVDSQIENLLS